MKENSVSENYRKTHGFLNKYSKEDVVSSINGIDISTSRLLLLMHEAEVFFDGPEDRKKQAWYECKICFQRFPEIELFFAKRPIDNLDDWLCPFCKSRNDRSRKMTFEEHIDTYDESFKKFREAREKNKKLQSK